MKQTKIISLLFVSVCLLFLISCDNSTTDTKQTDRDTTTSRMDNDDADEFPYNAALDPLTVEAAFANKLADTLDVKMYEVTLKPGDSVAIHNHPDHSLYVIEGGQLSITVQGGEAKVFDMKPGMAMLTGPENHNGKNVGKTTLKLLVHDIYRPRKK